MSDLFKQYTDAATVPPETKEAMDEKKRIQKESLGEDPLKEGPVFKGPPKTPKPFKPKLDLEEDDKPYESTGMKAVDRVRGLFRSGSKNVDKAIKDRYSKEVEKLPSGWSADQIDIITSNARNKRYAKRSSKR